MAATAMLSLPRVNRAPSAPSLPASLQIRPFGTTPQFRFTSSVDKVQASTTAVQFVRPDVPPAAEAAPAVPRLEKSHSIRARTAGGSALMQAAFVTNAKLADLRSKSKAAPFKLGFLGF